MSFGSGVVHSQNFPVPGDSDNLKNLANGCQINLWIGFPFAPKKKSQHKIKLDISPKVFRSMHIFCSNPQPYLLDKWTNEKEMFS